MSSNDWVNLYSETCKPVVWDEDQKRFVETEPENAKYWSMRLPKGANLSGCDLSRGEYLVSAKFHRRRDQFGEWHVSVPAHFSYDVRVPKVDESGNYVNGAKADVYPLEASDIAEVATSYLMRRSTLEIPEKLVYESETLKVTRKDGTEYLDPVSGEPVPMKSILIPGGTKVQDFYGTNEMVDVSDATLLVGFVNDSKFREGMKTVSFDAGWDVNLRMPLRDENGKVMLDDEGHRMYSEKKLVVPAAMLARAVRHALAARANRQPREAPAAEQYRRQFRR